MAEAVTFLMMPIVALMTASTCLFTDTPLNMGLLVVSLTMATTLPVALHTVSLTTETAYFLMMLIAMATALGSLLHPIDSLV